MSQHRLRVGVYGAIVREESLLVVGCDEATCGFHYSYPGGGVEAGETLHEALRREMREEVCAEIQIGPLLHVWEELPASDGGIPQLGLLFRCALQDGSAPRMPDTPDRVQVAVRWLPLSELPAVTMLPPPPELLRAALAAEDAETVRCETFRLPF